MPRNTCYWTRKLELQLVEFIRQREFIWKPIGNTNHHIQQKYRAYAEFAAQLGRGFTARSVRDRWVNIRNTFHYNLRKVEKSKLNASDSEVYVPTWPLWKPLQFLKDGGKQKSMYENKDPDKKDTYTQDESSDIKIERFPCNIKIEDIPNGDNEQNEINFDIRQRTQWTNRPRLKRKPRSNKCIKVLNNLISSLKPLVQERSSYYYFGRHVTERLNSMRDIDAQCASREIINYLEEMDFDTAAKEESS